MALIIKGQHLSRSTEFKKGHHTWHAGWHEPVEPRFNNKVLKLSNGCWEWLGGHPKNGYGSIKVDGKQMLVHRISYEMFKGIIPDGLTIDHLCKNRKCVNPEHLEAVTIGENVLRGNNPAAKNKRKTHCINGHEFSEENTYINPCNNQRVCITCHREYKRKWEKDRKIKQCQLL